MPIKAFHRSKDLSVLRILRVFRHLAEENLSWRNLTLTPVGRMCPVDERCCGQPVGLTGWLFSDEQS